jgi:ubiquinone biosynthesis protein
VIQAVRDLQRLREISAVVVRHGFGELLDRSRIWDVLGRREPGERPSPAEARASSARRFRETLADLGPTFIKLGQILSARPDILPPDFVAELSRLQDRAPPLPLETVLRVIERGLGKPWRELFAEIDPEPLASASIAQVHRAHLASGERVVVKVQRPGIEE